MAETIKKQYNNLNAIKIIAAFFVVCIHIRFPGDAGNAVVAVARFAVPFFFMVSGFFSYYPDSTNLAAKYKRKISHIGVIFAGSFLLYFAYDLLANIMAGSVSTYLSQKFSITSISELVLFNHVRVMEALWFLPALIYATLIFYFLEKKGITKKLYFLIPVLLLSGILLREVPEFIANAPAIMNKAYIYRNFVFVGLPFYMLGHFIRVNEEKLKEKLSYPLLAVMMLIGTAEAVAVDLLHTQKSVYVGTVIAVAAFFVVAIKAEGKVKISAIAAMGANYSLYVYTLHILVKNVYERLFGNVTVIPSALKPIIIFALALIASAVYFEIKKLFKILRKQEK